MKKTTKRIFVCSRLRGEYEKNLEIAKSLCRIVVMLGHIPIAPHVYFTQFLREEVESERKLGITLGLELLATCDEIWVFDFNGVSEGMEHEIDFALARNIPTKYVGNLDFPLTIPGGPVGSDFAYDETTHEQKQAENLD